MRLTTFSDYALRLLMYAAAAGERLITIEETSQVYKISRGHLMKIANTLTRAGYLQGVRGRSGGLTLAKKPEDIRLGDVVRISETDFDLVECFGTGNQCIITKRCRLPNVLNEALGRLHEIARSIHIGGPHIAAKGFYRPVPQGRQARPENSWTSLISCRSSETCCFTSRAFWRFMSRGFLVIADIGAYFSAKHPIRPSRVHQDDRQQKQRADQQKSLCAFGGSGLPQTEAMRNDVGPQADCDAI